MRKIGSWCFSATHTWPDQTKSEHVVYCGCKTRAEAEAWASEIRKFERTGEIVWVAVPAPKPTRKASK